MKINSKNFLVRPGAKVQLKEWPTTVKPFCESKKDYQELLEEHGAELSSLQHLHYASNRDALLLIFQGMDAGGKDGAIRHVMSGVNPQGCQVFSFKQPSADELEHDFLWRTTCRLLIMKRCWLFACTRRFSVARGFRRSCATRRPSGSSGIAPSGTWRATYIANREAARAEQAGLEPDPRALRAGVEEILLPDHQVGGQTSLKIRGVLPGKDPVVVAVGDVEDGWVTDA